MKRAVFIERDGVLNEIQPGPKNQIAPLTLEEFKVRKETEPSLARLKKAGYVLIVTTNQPGLSRGYQSRRELDQPGVALSMSVAVPGATESTLTANNGTPLVSAC